MEHGGRAVTEKARVSLCLVHRGPEVEAFGALHLNMDSGEAGQIGDFTK